MATTDTEPAYWSSNALNYDPQWIEYSHYAKRHFRPLFGQEEARERLFAEGLSLGYQKGRQDGRAN